MRYRKSKHYTPSRGAAGGSGGGITNGSATNELPMSDANGDLVASKIFSTSDGRLFGTALHNNAGAKTGTVNQYILSGTYSPVLTAIANVSFTQTNQSQWTRVGNVVTVSGMIRVDASAAGDTTCSIALPIASDIQNTYNASGTAVSLSGKQAAIYGDIANNYAVIKFNASGAGAEFLHYSFQYLIQ